MTARRTLVLVDRTLASLERFWFLISAIVFGVLGLGIVADVVTRNLTDVRMRGLIEYSEVALPVAVFLSLSYTEQVGGHVNVGLLTDRLRPRIRDVIVGCAQLATAAILAFLVALSIPEVIESVRSQEARYGFVDAPIWPGRMALTVGFLMWACRLALKGCSGLLHVQVTTGDSKSTLPAS